MIHPFLNHPHQIISVISDNREFYVNLALAVITFFAVLVALLQDWTRKKFFKPKLTVEIIKTPPDCHMIMLTDRETNAPFGYALYSRIRITNKSKIYTAQSVEVFISHFWKLNGVNSKEEIHTFLPMNLKWSHTGEIRTTVLPDFFRYCDFGSFRKAGTSVILLLDTIVQPNPVANGVVPNVIYPGKYEFEVVVSGENVLPQTKLWRLEFGDTWSDDENIMLENYKIEELK